MRVVFPLSYFKRLIFEVLRIAVFTWGFRCPCFGKCFRSLSWAAETFAVVFTSFTLVGSTRISSKVVLDCTALNEGLRVEVYSFEDERVDFVKFFFLGQDLLCLYFFL